MKKIFLALLLVTQILVLAACSQDNGPGDRTVSSSSIANLRGQWVVITTTSGDELSRNLPVTKDEQFSPAICTKLLRAGRLRKCSTYQRVCVRFSQAPEHQELATSHPAESLILGVINKDHGAIGEEFGQEGNAEHCNDRKKVRQA